MQFDCKAWDLLARNCFVWLKVGDKFARIGWCSILISLQRTHRVMLALLRLSSARSLMLLTLVQALDSRCFQKFPSAETNPWQSYLCRLCIIETFPKPGLGQRPRKSWSLAGSPQCVPAWSTRLDPPWTSKIIRDLPNGFVWKCCVPLNPMVNDHYPY